MIMRYLCALILLAAIFSMETAAQNTGTVRGVVDGPDGTAVPDASVAPTKDGDPLAVPSLFLAPSVFGNGSSSPQIVVDVVVSSSLDLPSSSVKNVAVDQNPYSAEFGRPGKGRLEVTTKRGVHN